MSAQRASLFLLWAGAALSAWFIGLFLYVSLPSLYYPFQLEWIEGQSVDTIYRAYTNQPIYTKPTLEYTALLYTPLFYHVSSLMAHVVGMDFVAGRMVSFLSALGTLWLLYRWVRREGGSPPAGLMAAGLYASTYHISGRWFDLARVDSLALCLLLAGLYGLRFGSSRRAAVWSGLALAAAFFTKQLTLGIALPVLFLTFFARRRFALEAGAACLGALALGMAYLEWASEGWFSFFCFRVAKGHSIDADKIWSFWQHDLFFQQPYVAAAAVLALLSAVDGGRVRLLWLSGLLAAALAAVYSARLHRYGYVNNLMPLHAVLALFAGLALAEAPRWRLPAAVLSIIQMIALLYNPTPFIPTAQSADMGNRFLKEIGAYPGEVFMPDVQFISRRVGKQSYSYGMGAYDVFRANLTGQDATAKHELGRALETAIAEGKFSVIIPGRLVHYGLPGLNFHYNVAKRVDYPEGYALDSLKIRSMVLYTPKQRQPEHPEPKP